MFTALLALSLPLIAGLVVGRTQMFESKDALIVLTRFALVVAFPALIIASWIDPRQGIDIAPWALVLVFVGPCIGTLAARAMGGKHRGSVALVALFGNSSFLGLPLAEAVVGPQAIPAASLAMIVHAALGVLIGIPLVRRDVTSSSASGNAWKALRSNPLLWAPPIGIALRFLLLGVGFSDHSVTISFVDALRALGRTSGPVGIFVLGLFLSRRIAAWPLRSLLVTWRYIVARLLLPPALTLLLGALLVAHDSLDATAFRVLVLQAATPAAISTFAMVFEVESAAGADASRPSASEEVAKAIVVTSLLAVLTMALFFALAVRLSP